MAQKTSTSTALSRKSHGAALLIRLRKAGIPCAANDAIGAHLKVADVDRIQSEVAARFQDVLDALVIDRDHNTANTANRVAKMFVREVFAGRYSPRPSMTEFPNARKLDQLYTVGPITVRSTCSHHFCPIHGQAWCGVIPGDNVIGLSKFSRLANWILARPQIQEEATVQLADELEALIKPRALAVVINASHACMTLRGVREHETRMVTSVMRGLFRDSPASRAEFLSLISGQGFRP